MLIVYFYTYKQELGAQYYNTLRKKNLIRNRLCEIHMKIHEYNFKLGVLANLTVDDFYHTINVKNKYG